MDLKALLVDFHHLGRDPFPTHLCVEQDGREPDVWNATDSDFHLVFLVDRRFDCHGGLRKMKPYLVKSADGDTYGWVDGNGNLATHGGQGVYDADHEKVAAWRPCDTTFDLRK